MYVQRTHGESGLVYTGRLCTHTQDVGFYRDIVWVCYSHHRVEEAVCARTRLVGWTEIAFEMGGNALWCRVHQVELARVLEHLDNARVSPQGRNGLAYLGVE